MSSRFLQRLRQQQSLDNREKNQHLYYLLNHDGQRLSLSLVVARVEPNGHIPAPQNYQLQPMHLEQPPVFLQPADIDLLRSLIQTEPDWTRASRGSLPERISQAWLQAVVATGRARAGTADNADNAVLCWGKPLAATCGWEIDEEGNQQLDWRPPPGVAIVDTHPPVYWHSERRQLGSLATDLDPRALAWLRRRPHLTPQQVSGFIDARGASFAEWGLPKPREIPLHSPPTTPLPELRLYRQGASDLLQLQFHYTDNSLAVTIAAAEPEDSYRRYDSEAGRVVRLRRDREAEALWQRKLETALSSCDPRAVRGDSWRFSGPTQWQTLTLKVVPELQQKGWRVTVEPGFRHYYVEAKRVRLDASFLDRDWFDLALNVEIDGEMLPLLPLLVDCARRYSQAELQNLDEGTELPLALPDGRQLLLPAARLARWLSVLVELRVNRASGPSLHLPRAQLDRLSSLDDGDLVRTPETEALCQQAQQRRTPPGLALFQLPAEFGAELRNYQNVGVAWLQQRRRLGLGGILADDMGLGKTVQTLAHLSIEHQQGRLRAPVLVVAPTSLLHNWRQEAAHFAPQLRCTLLHGPGRHRLWQQLQGQHLLLTSYALAANDIERWKRQPLSAVILDEAQTIKNSRARVSRHARELAAPYKICLTGTPMENHFGELWSLFDFMMPGFLDDESHFQRYYRKPIEHDGEQTRAEALMERIAPYILRRTKEEVAQDLPPKTEIVVRLPLSDTQRDCYETLRQQSVEQLHLRLKEKNQGEGRVLILNALMQLRQACCDPELVSAQAYRGTQSAKREHLLEMVKELVEEGRTALVFSQFTRMLEIIAADLNASGIDHLLLTGQSRQRAQLVEKFQAGAAPVFLISLKAGGTGLNLTRADTVIHYDPWWNSAAESQATDRAYRIGQDKPVFVYKLLAEDTVEEKIHALQQHKRNLLDQLYRAAESHTEQLALDNADLLSLLQ